MAIVAGEQAEKFSVNTTCDEAQVYDIIETGVNVCRFSASLNGTTSNDLANAFLHFIFQC